MIKHEAIVVSGTVIYCDKCETRGPQAAYEDAESVIDEAIHLEWQTRDDNDEGKDLCPKCQLKKKAKKAT